MNIIKSLFTKGYKKTAREFPFPLALHLFIFTKTKWKTQNSKNQKPTSP